MRHPRRNTRRLASRLAAWAFVPLLLAGCRPNKRYDLLEAELRTRERELLETRAALDRSRTINQAYDQSQGHPFPGAPVLVPAGVAPGCPVREISLGRGTGGVDDDGRPGDEALMVVIVPADEDKSAVKVPARATVAAWEVTAEGLKTHIGTWEVSAEQLRPTWRSGLIATGYFVTVPWQTFPTADRVRVAVRLTTTDGRAFEADRDVAVRPVAQAGPRAVPMAVPVFPGAVPPGVPPGVQELPPPMELDPDRPARLLPPVKQ